MILWFWIFGFVFFCPPASVKKEEMVEVWFGFFFGFFFEYLLDSLSGEVKGSMLLLQNKNLEGTYLCLLYNSAK